jgi:serine phosphatase RsbU (regulator of sigma subunit)
MELIELTVHRHLPNLPNLLMNAAYVPAKDVGGDFYQVIER